MASSDFNSLVRSASISSALCCILRNFSCRCSRVSLEDDDVGASGGLEDEGLLDSDVRSTVEDLGDGDTDLLVRFRSLVEGGDGDGDDLRFPSLSSSLRRGGGEADGEGRLFLLRGLVSLWRLEEGAGEGERLLLPSLLYLRDTGEREYLLLLSSLCFLGGEGEGDARLFLLFGTGEGKRLFS